MTDATLVLSESQQFAADCDLTAEKLLLHAKDPTFAVDAEALRLLAAALRYHMREKRAQWWPHFDRCNAELSDLDDDSEVVTISSVQVSGWGKEGRQRNLRRTITIVGRNCNPRDVFGEDEEVFVLYDNPAPLESFAGTAESRWWTKGTVQHFVDENLIIIETSTSITPHNDQPVAVIPGPAPDAKNIEKLLHSLAMRVLEAIDSEKPPFGDAAWSDVLRRSPPRQKTGILPHSGDDVIDVIKSLTESANSYVAVQGPPGSGKTYLGAKVIATLVKQGWKVGVVAQSHKTVEQLLQKLIESGIPVGKKNKGTDQDSYPWTVSDIFSFMNENSGGFAVGGTAWTFAATFKEKGPPLDLMVIDEAGQFSLAHTISAGSLASRLLLLGDPQQLAQVSQAMHEAPVDNSALSHLLGEESTISDDMGYFLEQSHRMHPNITRVISRLQYGGRLRAHEKTSKRNLEGIEPGVHLVLVDHEGRTTSSLEEAQEVAQLVVNLLGRTWHDFDANDQPTTEILGEQHILVVAAYNAQVRLVRRTLAEAGFDKVRVGTVDKFQGADQPVVIATLAASNFENLPRGLDFLISPNRINVALSRARWASYLVFSKELQDASPVSVPMLLNFGSFLGVLEESQRS